MDNPCVVKVNESTRKFCNPETDDLLVDILSAFEVNWATGRNDEKI
jgi:hypothetical protein